ncbi:alkaline phosphatase [Polaribacter reichenbachii]|uniref:Alkaline phosphatase n=1 Tax=Polaribacter reichenbachii TaxID=996801 RepID=A0A1B8TPS7_9FLAO|nr:alkaline phosphatase D family protein [Polaribacter reichenbachii]APZ46977.1 alkaline phosphatase [Polaribacter reichenbachii]AUC17620.1 alkaline phosphatase [Polaribacter reichenbachii]OBY61508.1 alkaline phosphatase [Polaribacter reichenbachii]
MKKIFIIIIASTILFSCVAKQTNSKQVTTRKADFTIAFGSCNKQNETNVLWQEVHKNNPDLWIWGGDIIYSDTENMHKMKKDYNILLNQEEYKTIQNSMPIMATWDDHDYGINDGGTEFPKKKEAQQLFLDFLNVDKKSERRTRSGVYHSKEFKTEKGSVKVIILDTRYHRTALTEAKGKKRYTPNKYGEGTILGDTQWKWLKSELTNSKADFNVIVSSIQVLSAEHGFETWGNFPHEVDQLKKIIKESKAKKVLLLSGDRHISEFSKTIVDALSYPLIDFTSSGLTHSYEGFTSEPNQYRIQKVISKISFGVLKFNFDKNKITMQMRGKDNILQQELIQVYH